MSHLTLTPSGIEQHSIPRSIVLHLLPGILIGAVFFASAPAVHRLGFPPFIALCLADLVVVFPLVLGYLLYLGHKKNGRVSLDGVVLYRDPMPRRQFLMLVPLLFVAWGTIVVLLTPISTFLFDTFFSWLPDEFVVTADLTGYSSSTLVISYLVYFLFISLTVPIVEELYFRGYLLPRLSRFGLWAPAIHSVLFAMYHVWTPWFVVARVFGVFPLAFAVHWKRNVYLGIVVHVLGNSVDVLIGVLFILRIT
jgi:uncharacterized protein